MIASPCFILLLYTLIIQFFLTFFLIFKVIPNDQDNSGMMPFHHAPYDCKHDCFVIYLAHKVIDIFTTDKLGKHIFYYECMKIYSDSIQVLFSSQTYPITIHDNQVPPVLAIQRGDKQIVQYLLSSRIVNANSFDYYGRTTLEVVELSVQVPS